MTNEQAQYKGVLFVACSVVLSACAQLLMKSGMLELASAGGILPEQFGLDILYESALRVALLWVVVGLLCYAVSMLFWMAALARYELSLAYPMLSISYVLVYIGAVLWPRFNESITGLRTSGIILIVIGVILVTKSTAKNASNTPISSS